MSSPVFNSQPPSGGKYYEGFKGKGMCGHCKMQFQRDRDGKLINICGRYGDTCKAVSRNCPGIPSLASAWNENFPKNKKANE